MNNSIITQDGYEFGFDSNGCQNCNGFCCRGESGYIWINFNEIERLAKYLNISREELSIKYLKKVKHRYSLIEKKLGVNDYACIFFDEKLNRCGIYEARPNQCKTFPFWQQFKNDKEGVSKECPAIK
ncbi:FIG00469387: hypothetical protein [hydrothermal vent metagenome]|uniref:YkgJ family cysteine cluster protein n=1 Tax=hydrothermal vent metagenome TaxID=652676 RepID=A0A1W1EII8_9ZZZZ